MKTCPDCAESIQDAARKCRFCGYRYDDEARTVPARGGAVADEQEEQLERSAPAAAGSDAPIVRASVSGPAWGYLLTALGGAGLFIAALAGAIALAIGLQNVGAALPIVNLAGFVGGGALLAIGWLLATLRGQDSTGGIVGGLALVAGQLIALALTGPDDELIRNVITTVAMAVCLYLHLGTLQAAGFEGTRVAAMFSLLGFGGLLFSFVKKLDLWEWLAMGLGWCAIVGLVLFGLALAVASMRRFLDG